MVFVLSCTAVHHIAASYMKVARIRKLSKTLVLSRTKDQTLSFPQVLGLVLWFILLSGIFTFLASGYVGITIPRYSAEDIARADIFVPTDISIEDKQTTELLRLAARERVLPVYLLDTSIGERTLLKLSRAFDQCRKQLDSVAERESSREQANVSLNNLSQELHSKLATEIASLAPEIAKRNDFLEFLVREQFSMDVEVKLKQVLRQAFASSIVNDNAIFSGHEQVQIINSTSGEEATAEASQVLTLTQARNRIDSWMKQRGDAAPRDQTAFRNLAATLLEPNLRFDLAATQARQAQATVNVDPVLIQLKKGKMIVRQGDEIHPEQLKQIEAIRALNLNPFSVKQVSGKGILIGFLLLIFGYFLRPHSQAQWSYLKLVGLFSLLLLTNILFVKGFWFVYEALSQNFVAAPFNDKAYFFFALPFAFGSMLATLLTGERTALIFSVCYCVLAGLTVESDFYGFFYILMSNLIGSLAVRKAIQRVGIVGAGFKVGLAATSLFLVLQISRQVPIDLLSAGFGAALAFVSGPLSTGLLVFALPIYERLFMVTTDLRLLELGNLNLPLIRHLILRAPGTYNHSVAVGTLSEGAAKAIGLNPLFVRVACLYHDIGKSVHPEYFVENQQGFNIHDRISAEESVKVVTGHVAEGIRMARDGGIPHDIVDIIPQHHGTKVLTFFFEKAKSATGSDDFRVREKDFRYPGPKPQSKEAAIIMLADAVEASARTLRDHSQEKLLELIQRIVSATTEDGQLSECDITLAEIDRIAFSLLETLSSVYHSRITYPGFEFNEQKSQESSKMVARS